MKVEVTPKEADIIIRGVGCSLDEFSWCLSEEEIKFREALIKKFRVLLEE